MSSLVLTPSLAITAQAALISPTKIAGTAWGKTTEVVRMKRESLAACMLCDLWEELLENDDKPTVILECLHTLCRNCITQKFTDEGLNCCPICKVVLGTSPLEKLRTDNNLQDVRAKLFPAKRKADTFEVNTPPVRTQTGSSKSTGRKNSPNAEPSCLAYKNDKENAKSYLDKDNIVTSLGSGKGKRPRSANWRKQLQTTAQALVDASCGKPERGRCPVWFSLVASAYQTGNAPLHQLSTPFLRITNPSLPASYLQKYLAQKLDLPNESEVDIACRGQPVNPTTPLHGLVDMWLSGTPSHKVKIPVGSSGKEFVVVITYSRSRKALERYWTAFKTVRC